MTDNKKQCGDFKSGDKLDESIPEYKCTICGETLMSENDMDIHSEKVHYINWESTKKDFQFKCDECERSFTTKQGRSLHKTVKHKKENEQKNIEKKETTKKQQRTKRMRSVEEKTLTMSFKCKECNYVCKSKWALKNHKNHKHKEPTSPNEKKPKITNAVVDDILSELFQSIGKENPRKNKTTIEPTRDFLSNTAKTLAEMLDEVADQIDVDDEDENDDTEDLENRLDILRGDKPRHRRVVEDNQVNTLVTLPLKDVEELRQKIRSLEDVNKDLAQKLINIEELENKCSNLEDLNTQLKNELKETKENNVKNGLKKKEQTRVEFMVIDMETNDEDDGIERLISNKGYGYSRSNPQSGSQKNPELSGFDCTECGKKFGTKLNMINHQKTHEVICWICDKKLKNSKDLQEHKRIDHDEMICHMQCGGGKCKISESGNLQTENISVHKCNFCGKVFPSQNTLSTHRGDVHRTFKPCRDMINCPFQGGCYFSHVPITEGKVRCFQCGEEFDTKHNMMIHRKEHGSVKVCIRLLNNQCERGDSCWWSHVGTQQDFQEAQENLRPPIQRPMMQQQQNNPNILLVNMLKSMDIELKKIKEVLNIN